MIPVLLWLVLGVPDWLDFEVVTIFAIALAGVGMMYRDAKADRAANAEILNLAQRVSMLEATPHPPDLTERVAKLEASSASENPETIAERVAKLEVSVDVAHRIAVLEARADHQPWRHTRRKDGKFASPDVPAPKEPTP